MGPTQKIVRVIPIAALPVLAACAHNVEQRATTLDQELADLLEILPGQYAGKAPAGLNPDGKLQQLVHAFRPVTAPQFGENVQYYHITRDTPDGAILQAKLFVFDSEPSRAASTMRAFVLRAEQAESLRTSGQTAWAKVDPASLMSFPDTCYFTWKRSGEGFRAEDADTCSYQSIAFSQTITPDMTYTISPEQFVMEETLVGEDGTAIVSTGGPIVSLRISD